MPKYTLKILLDFDSLDDLAARQKASALVSSMKDGLQDAREIVLQAPADRKSIKMNPDGSYQGQWNRGGARPIPGQSD